MYFGRSLLRRRDQGLGARLFVLVLGLLGSLPEEQIGADRRPEDGDDRNDIVLLPGKARHQGVNDDLTPRHIHHQDRGDIGEERERSPLQNPHVPFVTQKDLQSGTNDGEQDDVEMGRPTDEQAQRFAHCSEVGPEIDDIGNQQHRDDHP